LQDWFRIFRRTKPSEQAGASSPETTQDFPALQSMSVSSGGTGHLLRVGVVSEVGNVREHNEDNFFVPGRPSLVVASDTVGNNGSQHGTFSGEYSLPPTPPAAPPPPPDEPSTAPPEDLPLFVVADGMGGQLAGERASAMAVEIIPDALRKRLGVEEDDKAIRRAIQGAVAEANKEILAQSHLVTEFANMGTTIVLILFRADRAYVAGIGDSRAYRLRGGRLEPLTIDHSLARALVDAGTIRPEEAENHKFRHVLYNYLGCKDARDGPDEIRMVDVRPGDCFLLASDGLTGVVRDEVIAEVLQGCEDPQRAAQALIHRALENRSKDNITCVVVQVA
jgi:protein phosphatase